MNPRRIFTPAVWLLLAAAIGPVAAATESHSSEVPATTAAFRALHDAMEAARIDPSLARSIGRSKFEAGPAMLEIRGGVIYPVLAADRSVVEIVFLGRAKFTLATDDRVERDQLELFTGAPRLDATVTRAVFVVSNQPVIDALLSGPPLPAADPALEARARDTQTAWRTSPERRRRGIEIAMLTNRIEGQSRAGYFAAWMHDEDLGEFLYTADPDRDEQVTAVQFVPLEMTDIERQWAINEVRKDQRKGRYKDTKAEDLLGDWNTWFTTPPSSYDGTSGSGAGPFRATHYDLDVTIDRSPLEVRTVAGLDMEATRGGRRVVQLDLSSDVEVLTAKNPAGRELPFLRIGSAALVILDREPAAGEKCEIVVETLGRIIDDTGQGSWALRDTVNWHPRIDFPTRATWSAAFLLPKGFDLVASGRVVEEALRDGRPFQRRVLEAPALGFSFEIGKFRKETRQVGHVALTVAFDPLTRLETDLPREEIVRTAVEALEFYEATFGPYPLDTMTIVTSQRFFSQGLLGFLSLSAYELSLEHDFRRFVGQRDARTVLAHEIAHQWWGNVVGWRSDRDQWISEAMATYASNLYTRRKMKFGGKGQVRISQTARWWRPLQEISERGIPVEELGPVILGGRLSSSLERNAYNAIVYVKGAVVLDTLSRYFTTEDAFIEALRNLVTDSRGKLISTEEFLALLERHSGLDLEPFANRFIYATGVPMVVYRFDFAKSGEGWSVHGTTDKIAPAKRRFGIVKLADGRFDLVRTITPVMDVDAFPLVVPSSIGIVRKSESPPDGNAQTVLERCNSAIEGRHVLDQRRNEFNNRVEDEPRGAWLDLQRETYVIAVDEHYYPKRAFYYRGLDAWARGDSDAAESAFRSALAASGDVPYDRPRPDEEREYEKFQLKAIDIRAAAALAHILMDRGDLVHAKEYVARATTIDGYLVRLVRRDMLVTNARFEILNGKPDKALSILKREIFAPLNYKIVGGGYTKGNEMLRRVERGGPLKDPAAFALAAIAAKQTGDEETLANVFRAARRYGVDVAPLEK